MGISFLFDPRVMAASGLTAGLLVVAYGFFKPSKKAKALSSFSAAFVSGAGLPIGLGIVCLAFVEKGEAHLDSIRVYLPLAGASLIWLFAKTIWQIATVDAGDS